MSELVEQEKWWQDQTRELRKRISDLLEKVSCVEAERDEWKEEASAGTLDPQRITDLIRERDALKLRVLELEEQQSDSADEARFHDR